MCYPLHSPCSFGCVNEWALVLCACRLLVHKWIKAEEPVSQPKSIASKCMGWINVSWKLFWGAYLAWGPEWHNHALSSSHETKCDTTYTSGPLCSTKKTAWGISSCYDWFKFLKLFSSNEFSSSKFLYKIMLLYTFETSLVPRPPPFFGLCRFPFLCRSLVWIAWHSSLVPRPLL